jgi:hypothetical protein
MAHTIKVATCVTQPANDLARRVQSMGALLNSGFSHPNFDKQDELNLRSEFLASKKLLSRNVQIAWAKLTIYTIYEFADIDAAREYLTNPVIANKMALMGEQGITVVIEEGSP